MMLCSPAAVTDAEEELHDRCTTTSTDDNASHSDDQQLDDHGHHNDDDDDNSHQTARHISHLTGDVTHSPVNHSQTPPTDAGYVTHPAVNHHVTPPTDAGHVTSSSNDVVTLPPYSACVGGACQPSCSPCRPVTRHQSTNHKHCKDCCLRLVVKTTSLRCLLLVVVFMGVACMIAGISLAALNMTVGHNYFTASITLVGQSLSMSALSVSLSLSL